jgi:hypothetical protein
LRQTVFFRRHRFRPKPGISRNDCDCAFEIAACEALGCKDLPDFLAFSLGNHRDVAALDAQDALIVVVFGSGTEVVAGRHGKSVGDKIGEAEKQQHAGRQLRAGNAGYDRECRHGAVDTAVDPVTQVVGARPTCEAFTDSLLAMTVFQCGRHGAFQLQKAMRALIQRKCFFRMFLHIRMS